MKSLLTFVFFVCFFSFSFLSKTTGQIDYKGMCSIGCPSFCREDCVRGLRRLEEILAKSPDINSRMEAAKSLGQFQGTGRIPILERALKKEPAEKVKEELKKSLLKAETDLLEKGSSSEKKEAMDRLQKGGYGNSFLIEKFSSILLTEPEEDVRTKAGNCLYWLGEEMKKKGEDIDKIVEVFKKSSEEDISPTIRKGATQALDRLK